MISRYAMLTMKKIICFGDTITEMGLVVESRGFVARLAERYIRRADVLARGYSGYTTREALAIVEPAVLAERPMCVILFFGACDSVMSDQFQHVPIDEYRENIRSLATQIAASGAWLMLVTPPPLDERKTRSRQLAHTEKYALACYEIALEMNLPVIDLFHLIQQQQNWEKKCLMDGIHLSAQGMDVFYEAIVQELNNELPPNKLPRAGVEGL